MGCFKLGHPKTPTHFAGFQAQSLKHRNTGLASPALAVPVAPRPCRSQAKRPRPSPRCCPQPPRGGWRAKRGRVRGVRLARALLLFPRFHLVASEEFVLEVQGEIGDPCGAGSFAAPRNRRSQPLAKEMWVCTELPALFNDHSGRLRAFKIFENPTRFSSGEVRRRATFLSVVYFSRGTPNKR